MEYRKLGRSDLTVSAIGVGLEHVQGKPASIAAVMNEAIDQGVNYFDLHVSGDEDKEAVAGAIRGRREDLVLAWHLGLAQANGQYRRTRDLEECRALMDDLLQRLGTDHVDVLHLHNIDEEVDLDQVLAPGGVAELAQALKGADKARLIGYSGHSPKTALKAVESGVLDVIMYPITIPWPNREQVLSSCASRGVGVIAMKTYAGGAIFTDRIPVTPVQCISYTLAQPGVATVAVGVRSCEELHTALHYLDASSEERDYSSYVYANRPDLKGRCLYCNHCLPCPSTIDIASLMRLLEPARSGVSARLREHYEALGVKASACIECGACVERCPFGLDVRSQVQELRQLFEGRETD